MDRWYWVLALFKFKELNMKTYKPEVQAAMKKIHKDALKAGGKVNRPAVLCECGCTVEQHMSGPKGEMGPCVGCADRTLLVEGKLTPRCHHWAPVRTSVKALRKEQRRQADPVDGALYHSPFAGLKLK